MEATMAEVTLESLCAPGIPKSAYGLEQTHTSPYDSMFKRLVIEADDGLVEAACDRAMEYMQAQRLAIVDRHQILRPLLGLVDNIRRNAQWLAQTEARWTSRCIRELMDDSLPKACETMEWFCRAQEQDQLRTESLPRLPGVSYARDPVGVVAAITPWNDPLVTFAWKVVPPLLSGNCVIWKPSEYCPETARWIVEQLYGLGLPPERLQVVLGGPVVGATLAKQPVDGISFTGSFRTALHLSGYSQSNRLRSLHLESGGKGCVYLQPQTDIGILTQWAKSIAKASFYNQGQICSAPAVLLTPASQVEAIVAIFQNIAGSFAPSDPTNPDSRMGGLVSQRKKEQLEALLSSRVEVIRLTDAQASPTGFQPTLVVQPPRDSTFVQDELFGPILTLLPCESAIEAAAFINRQSYGLANGIYSLDRNEQSLFTQSAHSGILHVNCWGTDPVGVPFGGTRNSGDGKEKCIDTLNHFTNVKPICHAP
jgi:gamma-glutamyl-gamma-aminobutyraldehyde dehydrogenase